jgi:hypothetical protein
MRLSLGRLANRHQLALEWIAEAWGIQSPPVKFTNLWSAVVVAVDSTYTRTQRRKTQQMHRVRDYLLRLPLSQHRRDNLQVEFETAYSIRNRIEHEGERGAATHEALEALDRAVHEFLIADLGRS